MVHYLYSASDGVLMMGKLIDVQSAREVSDAIFGDPFFKMAVNAVLNNTQGFDLVRCKDCIYYECGKGYTPWCNHFNGLEDVGEDDFCSYGERKNNDGK